MKGGPTCQTTKLKAGRNPEIYEIDIESKEKDATKTQTKMYGVKACYHQQHEGPYSRNVTGLNTNTRACLPVDRDSLEQLKSQISEAYSLLNAN